MSSSTRRFLGALAQAGVVALVAVLASCGEESPPELAAKKPNPVLLIGIDGATWDVINPMIDQGDLPTFDRLKRSGAYGRLLSLAPLTSPVVWTTIATGRFPRHHNILDHTYPYVDGEKKKISSAARRVPALWNIASKNNRTVGVVNWFATHPPEIVNGYMISDRAAEGASGASYPVSTKELAEAVVEEFSNKEIRRTVLRRFLPWDFDRTAARRPEDKYHRVTEIVTNRVDTRSVYDEIVRELTEKIIAEGVDLCMTYFRLIDHVSHASWIYFDSSEFPEPPMPFDRALLQDLIPEAYRYMDEVLADLLGKAGETTNVIIVSDHGFGPWYSKGSPLTGNHKRDGIFLAVGPDIQPGEIHGISTMELAPTILALSGLPVSRELPGRIEERVLREGYLNSFPVLWTDAYDYDWQSAGEAVVSTEIEEEALKTLQALGYLGQDATSTKKTESSSEVDFWGIERKLKRRALVGEMSFNVLRNKEQEWRSLSYLILEMDPGLMQAVIRGAEAEVSWFQDNTPLGLPGVESTARIFPLLEELRRLYLIDPSTGSGR